MTEASGTSSGTNSGQSGRSSSVSNEQLGTAIDKLLKRGQQHGEISKPEPEEREQQEQHEQEDTGNAAEAAGDTGERDRERESSGRETDGGETPAGSDQGEQEQDAGEPGAAVDGEVTLRDVARRLKIPVKELYKQLTVPLSDGTGRRVSVEDLKAAYIGSDEDRLAADRHSLAEEQAVFAKDREDQQQKLVRERHEFDMVVQLLAENTPQPVLEALSGQVRQAAAREAQMLLDHMPEFRDRTAFQAWQGDAQKVLGAYGFSPAEITNLADHRIYRFVDAHLKLLGKIDAIENLPEQERKPPKAPQRRYRRGPDTAKAAVEKAKRTGHEKDKVAAIGALLTR